MTSITKLAPISMLRAANETHISRPDSSATELWGGHDDMDKHITNPHLCAPAAAPRAHSAVEPGKVRLALDILSQLQDQN